MTKGQKIFWIVIIAGMVFRVAILLTAAGDISRFTTPDSYEYIKLGKNLITEGIYSTSDNPPFKPEALRPPAYPVIIGILHSLIGLPLETMLILNILLTVITALICYLLARNIGGETSGIIAGAFVFLEGGFAVNNMLILTEAFFTSAVLGSVYFFIKYLEKRQLGILLLSVLLWTVSIYIRVASLYLFLMFALILLVIKDSPFKKRLKAGAIVIALGVLSILPWAFRNYVKFDIPAFSTTGAFVLYCHKAASVESELSGIPVKQAQDNLYYRAFGDIPAAAHDDVYRPCGKEITDYYMDRGISYITDHPFTFIETEIKGILILLSSPGTKFLSILADVPYQSPSILIEEFLSNEKRQGYHWLFLLFMVYQGIFLFILLLGFVYGLFTTKYPASTIVVVATAVYFIIIAADLTTGSRLKIPALPFMAIISAIGISNFRIRLGR
ncbi:MAG: hypothetical protein GF307_02780 [candidate division Zixibacteria bacterium]|nr:hypothetical protein [candidate division Zixibacteria bacterium]